MIENEWSLRRSTEAADEWLTPGRFALLLGLLIVADLSRRAPGRHHLHHPGFRHVQLSGGLLSPAMLLARRTAALESVQQLRASLPGPVEHADPLPALAHLPAAALDLVAVVLLPGAPVLGRAGHVLSGPALDQPPAGGRAGGGDLLVQRVVAELPDVAEPRSHVQLAAVGGVAGATGLARGRQGAGVGDGGGRHADAGGRARDDCADLADPVGPGVRRLDSGGGAADASLCGAFWGWGFWWRWFARRNCCRSWNSWPIRSATAAYSASTHDWSHAVLGLGQFPGAAVPNVADGARACSCKTGSIGPRPITPGSGRSCWPPSRYGGCAIGACARWRCWCCWGWSWLGATPPALPRAALLLSCARVCPLPGEIRHPGPRARSVAGRVWLRCAGWQKRACRPL